MAMNQASVHKFVDRINPGGALVYNKSLIQDLPGRKDISNVPVAATQIASEMGNPQVANMAALGGLLPVLDIIRFESLAQGLPRILPENRQTLIPLNEMAIKKGMAAVMGIRE